MQSDCEIYVDPEEDEVFFGCVSEREKNICSKLLKYAEPNLQDFKSNKLKIDEDNVTTLVRDEEITKDSNEVIINYPTQSATNKNLETAETNDGSLKIFSTDVSVELDHSYSTPMKHKIDKSILTTPKSVVKADRDGGFLKVLSEIALVKAEAEGNKEAEKEDENKENKIVQSLPEIQITEATPEKKNVQSPPRSIKTEIRRFRIIYNSPQNEDNVNHQFKSHSEGIESEKKLRNKCLEQEVDKGKSYGNRKSVNLIDFNKSGVLNEVFLLKGVESEDLKQEMKKDSENNSCDSDEVLILNKEKLLCEIPLEVESSENPEAKKLATGNVEPPETVSVKKETPIPIQRSLRFSKEARKVVEVLKKSAVDDTLNFTIPEMNPENEDISFLSPESMPAFSDAVTLNKSTATFSSKVVSNNKLETKSKTVEKERCKLTPVISRSKLQPLKYLSERKINKQPGEEVSRCAKKLPLRDIKAARVQKVNDNGARDYNAVPGSRIPVFSSKNSKLPNSDRLARPLASRSTPSRIASVKSYKNPKFNHIESPINAYIHNKPTSLIQNIKPELKEDCLSKVWQVQATKSTTKLPDKTSASTVRLPFVEYKSGTPYNVEKRSESRLPRLAPTVRKLIGTDSPKVLKHEGRFYMKTPKKQCSTENSTIVAEPNEVSVVVSHPAQKSCTFK